MEVTPEVVASYLGIGVSTLSLALQGYPMFRKSNVEKFFEKLIESNEDIKIFGSREDLQRQLFSIIEKVSNEANQDKIEHWKNAVIRLATDFKDFDFKDNFIRTLDYLTVFDMTVLFEIYSRDFDNENFEEELLNNLTRKHVPSEIAIQSLKSLSSHGLVSENYDSTAVFGDGKPILNEFHYKKNALGPKFLRFISDGIVSVG